MKRKTKKFLDRYFHKRNPSVMNSNAMISIDLDLVRESEKAILIKHKDRQVWLPKSQVIVREKTVLLLGWLYKEKFV